MLACYGIPCSFTKVVKTHKPIVCYYVQNAVSRGILSFGPLVTGYSATCRNDDSKPCFICCSASEVVNSAEVGFSEPGLDYCPGGGSRFGFCFGRSCMWVQRLWRSSCVRVCQRVTEGQGKVRIVFWSCCLHVAVA